jgi:hypothetical protein
MLRLGAGAIIAILSGMASHCRTGKWTEYRLSAGVDVQNGILQKQNIINTGLRF